LSSRNNAGPNPTVPAAHDGLAAYPVAFDPTGSVSRLPALIEGLSTDFVPDAIVVLAAEGNGWTADDLSPVLKQPGIPPLLGGIFPAVIHDSLLRERGTVLVGLRNCEIEILPIPNLDDLRQLRLPAAHSRDSLYLTFADGLSRGVCPLIEEFQYQIGPRGTVLGGGSGSGTFRPIPSVIAPEGLFANAAVVCRLEAASTVEVSHGWTVASDILKATESSGVQIRSINYRPAFGVYQEVVADLFGVQVTREAFSDVAFRYPLGIERLNQEVLVRDPVGVDADGCITCVGTVPEGSFLRLLQGMHPDLEAAALVARARLDEASAPHALGKLDLAFDCVSRRAILPGGIQREIESLGRGTRLVGALTLGEIAHPSHHRVEFLNKSIALARLQPAN